jgi:phosphatidylserine/phosphatidylglycerophosphate/cardiolipin synthase-like enzyme
MKRPNKLAAAKEILSMAMETVSAAGGNIEVMFLQQVGNDPFTPTLERAAQISEVASRIARFISEARATLDIAIYDFQLRDDAAAIVADALRERAKNNVVIRIIYDAATDLADDALSTASPAHLEADRKRPGTESFVRSFSDIAQIKGITGYRVLMHNKYIVRDGNSAEAAVITGSSNYTNDSWGLQENNLLCLRSQLLASNYSKDFTDLSTGRIAEGFLDRDVDVVRVAGVPVTVASAPERSPAIVKEIVGAIAAARRRLLVASVVLSSGPILAALSEAIDRGLQLGGIYDGPQMDQVRRQWVAAHVGVDKINTWDKISNHLIRKNSLPFDRNKPHQPHNFMHDKLVIADDVVVTGSFNLSNHAMGNAENVLLIRDAGIASKYEAYIQQVVAKYRR